MEEQNNTVENTVSIKKRDLKFTNKSMKDFIKLGGHKHDMNLVRSNAGRLKLSHQETLLLVEYYKLITQTDYLVDKLKDFFVNGLSYVELTEKYGKADWNNIIAKGLKDIYDDFGNDIFYAVVHKELSDDTINSVSKLIKSKLDGLGYEEKDTVSSYFSFDINSESKIDLVFNSKIDDDEFSDMCDIIKPFSVPYQKLLLGQLEPEHIGYIKHILDAPESHLSKKDLERKRHIVSDWGLI